MRLELIFAESAFNKTFLYRRVRAPITKTRPNNTRQRAKSKKSATPTSKGKFYENADSANIMLGARLSDLLCMLYLMVVSITRVHSTI